MKTQALSILVLLLCGCGSGDPATTPTKDLFSSWAEVQPANGMVADLSKMAFGQGTITFALKAGGACSCTIGIGGTQSAGNMDLSACTFSAMGTTNTDPGCSALSGNVTYTNAAAVLTLCRVGSTTCSTWQ